MHTDFIWDSSDAPNILSGKHLPTGEQSAEKQKLGVIRVRPCPEKRVRQQIRLFVLHLLPR